MLHGAVFGLTWAPILSLQRKGNTVQARFISNIPFFVLLRQDPMKRDYGDVRILQAFFLSHCYNKDCLYAILPEVYLLN